MLNEVRSSAPFYTGVMLYALYIFLVNWTKSAERILSSWPHEFFSAAANAVLIACFMLVFYIIARDFRYYVKNKWFTLISIAAIVFLSVTLNSISIVLPIILGFVSINSNNRVIANTIVKSLSVLLLISCTFYFLGLNGGDAVSKPLFGEDNASSIMVPSLGLSNPNSVMLIFINIIALSLYLSTTKKQTFYTSIILTLMTIIFSSITGSTTGLVVGLITIFFVVVTKHYLKITELLRKFTAWMFIIVTIITFFTGITFGPQASLPNPVNDTLTTRPYMWNLRIENNSFLNIYGNNDQYATEGSSNGGTTYALDNMILYILVHYGLVVYLVFFLIFYSGSRKIYDPAILVYILVVCTLMIVERMYLYSIVLIFLQKEITEHYLLKKKDIIKGTYV